MYAPKTTISSFRRGTAFVPRRRAVATSAFLTNDEPELTDLLDDPITRRLMASDGITPDALQSVIASAQERLRQ